MIARKVDMKIKELKKNYSIKHIQIAFFSFIAIFSLVAAYFGYRWYFVRRQKFAHTIFSESVDIYNKAINAKDNVKLKKAIAMFDSGYKKCSDTSIAPFFLLFKARALSEDNKIEEAIALMEDGINLLSQSSSFFYMYKNSLALMKIDSDNDIFISQGLATLKAFAYNEDNPLRDMSLYYSGFYFYSQNETKKAYGYWNDLVLLKSKKQFFGSPFVRLAEEKLKEVL